ncbi:MAG: hypothetical protein J7K68_01760 [Candidatus Diapherotrites archaeon]|nr:hypothetical protein [Candidatus Diapherotrites archaeon]
MSILKRGLFRRVIEHFRKRNLQRIKRGNKVVIDAGTPPKVEIKKREQKKEVKKTIQTMLPTIEFFEKPLVTLDGKETTLEEIERILKKGEIKPHSVIWGRAKGMRRVGELVGGVMEAQSIRLHPERDVVIKEYVYNPNDPKHMDALRKKIERIILQKRLSEIHDFVLPPLEYEVKKAKAYAFEVDPSVKKLPLGVNPKFIATHDYVFEKFGRGVLEKADKEGKVVLNIGGEDIPYNAKKIVGYMLIEKEEYCKPFVLYGGKDKQELVMELENRQSLGHLAMTNPNPDVGHFNQVTQIYANGSWYDVDGTIMNWLVKEGRRKRRIVLTDI